MNEEVGGRGVTVRDVSWAWACKVVRDEGTTYGFVGGENTGT